MNDENTDASGTMSSSRLSQFEAEVAKLKVTGGGANPERLGSQWGIGLTILGFVIAIIAWWSALDGKDALSALRARDLRCDRRGYRGGGRGDLGAQLADPLPALLDHPPRLRTA